MIFVSYKKGPKWWTNISYFVFKIGLILVYVLIPAFNLISCTCIYALPKFVLTDNPISSWVIFWTILCTHRILEFFTVIRKSLLLDARIHYEQKGMEN
jgi:hypothetical protein